MLHYIRTSPDFLDFHFSVCFQMLSGVINAGTVDCQKHHSFCQSENVRAYPEIRLFPQNTNRRDQYQCALHFSLLKVTVCSSNTDFTRSVSLFLSLVTELITGGIVMRFHSRLGLWGEQDPFRFRTFQGQ